MSDRGDIGKVAASRRAHLKCEGQAGKDGFAIAYEKNVPTDGGYVLLSAGTVKKMSAAEFAAAPKAGAT